MTLWAKVNFIQLVCCNNMKFMLFQICFKIDIGVVYQNTSHTKCMCPLSYILRLGKKTLCIPVYLVSLITKGMTKAQEERVHRRTKMSMEGAFQTSHKNDKKKEIIKASKSIYAKEGNSTEKKGKFSPCGIRKRTNHQKNDCRWKGKTQCNYCKWFDHVEKDYKRKQNQAQAKAQVSD